MFQVDAGRSAAVHSHQPRRSVGPETSAVVADQLDSLLGEHLLPLRPRVGDEDAPHLLAVDAAGQPVVVEVVSLLDHAALLRAMRHAGRAARLSTEELAQTYRGGADRFAADLAAFRETVPVTSLLPTTVHGGSRLLLVCSEVAEGMEDAIEFLLQPGWQVEVLQVGVVRGSDGQRVVDVSPVTRTTPSRRAMEPSLRHTARTLRTVPFPEGGPARRQPRAVTPTLADPAPAAPTAPPARRLPTVVPPPFAVRLVATTPHAPHAPHAPDAPDAPDSMLPYAFTGIVPPVQARPDPRLVRLAAELGEPVALVWSRRRRGECFEALLRPDGVIELPDGSHHTDPSTAAVAASCASGPVDGWRVWRIDSAWGRTLDEVCGP